MPTVRRIIIGVHGSLGSLQALRFAADEARQRNVPLLAVTAWIPPGGDLAERRHSSPYLRKIWREAAWERLWAAFDAGLGGMDDSHLVPAGSGIPSIFAGLILSSRSSSCSVNPFARNSLAQFASASGCQFELS